MFYDAQLVGALNFVRLAKTFGYHSYKIGSQSEGLRIKIGSCVSGQCAQAILNHVKRLSQTGHLHKIILLVGIYDLLVTAVDYWAECCLPTTAMDTRVTTGRAVKSYEQSAAPSEGVCRLLRAGEDVSVQVLCVLCQVTAVDYWVECCLPTTAMATRVTTGRAVKSYEQSAAPSEGVCRLLRAGEDVSVQVLCVLCQVTAVDYWAECCLPTTAMATRVTTGRAVKSYEQSAAPSEGVCRLLRAGEDVSVQVLCVLCQVTAVDYWAECCLPTTAMATRVTTGRAVKSYEQSAAPSEGVCRLLRAGEDVSVQVLCVLCQVTAVDYWAECCLPTTAMATRVTTGRAVKSYEQSAAPSEGVRRLLRAGEDVSVQVLCVLCQVTAVDYWAECCLPTTAMDTRVTTGRAVKSYEQSAAPSEGVCRLLRAGEDVSVQVLCVLCQVTAVDYWVECCLPTTAMATRVTTGRAVKSYEQSAAPSEGVCRLLRAGEDVSVQVLCVLCQVTAVDYWVECCLPTTAMATRVTTGRAVKSYEQSAAPSEGVCRLLRAGEDVSVQVLCVLCQVTAVDYWVECCLPTTAMATRVTTGRAVKSYEQSAAPSEGVCRLLRAGEDVSVQVLCVLCQVTAVDYWVECCLPTTAMATRVTTGRAVKSYEQSAAPSEGVCRLLRAGEDVTAVDYWVECCLPTTAMDTRVTTGRSVKSYEQSAAPSEGVCRLLRAGEDVSVQVLCVLCQVTAVDYWVECCLPTTAMATRVTTGRAVKSYEQSAAPSEGVRRLLRAGEDLSFCRFAVRDSTCVCAWRLHPWEGGGGF
ncbi:uncharacterized protein LOC134536810 isoform X12 [Bacillus rossius redtenbacheri]|uniref:uncharacterized protein LOC134536810 isoform X12 n=1 Tax=Bacillus rossius redtenbacheri TaxID=93214 RepID=UPI002FDD7075